MLRLGGDTAKAQPAADDKAPETAIQTSFVKVTERKLPPTLEASGTLAADGLREVRASQRGPQEVNEEACAYPARNLRHNPKTVGMNATAFLRASFGPLPRRR